MPASFVCLFYVEISFFCHPAPEKINRGSHILKNFLFFAKKRRQVKYRMRSPYYRKKIGGVLQELGATNANENMAKQAKACDAKLKGLTRDFRRKTL